MQKSVNELDEKDTGAKMCVKWAFLKPSRGGLKNDVAVFGSQHACAGLWYYII